ncbi:MAG: tRNA lysidine(34) synthetase TilS [Myxococcales bacterium]|nr:tRNA lysidine(34) synthetase TilS [Myxococcales bacterium]
MRRTVRERALLSRGERVLVAVSGGPDSAALLSVLARLDAFELVAASVDHGLRPDADRDVAVAGELAASLGVPFHALRVEVAGEGASVQAAARDARYEALHALAAEVGASSIAVGHTLDDQAETVLSRLLRGASLLGLTGIEPRRADGVVRPLIDCRRAEVRAHVERFELPHVVDPSNANGRFERVRLRGAILPALAEEDPNVAVHLARLADEARAIRDLLDAEADPILDGATDAIAPVGPPPVRARAIQRWIEARTGLPAKRAHLEALLRGDEALLPGGLLARVDGPRITAEPRGDRRTRSEPREE